MRPTRLLVLLGCACSAHAWPSVWDDALARRNTSPATDPIPELLRKGKHHCADLHEAKDRCHHALKYCSADAAGYIDYLSWFYCDMAPTPVLGFIILSSWGAFLFSTIGIASSDFFCPNLATIADLLGMSQSVAGVTLLAFGNGSPDVFSTFAAFRANSGSLAIGELLGAAAFITSVVAGTMAIIAPFKVSRNSFLRDAGFFSVAVVMTMILLADGRLRLWEAAAMIVFYVLYVVVVLLGTWYSSRTKRKAKLRERVQSQYASPNGSDDPQALEQDSEPIMPSRRSTAEESDHDHDHDHETDDPAHRHVYQDLNSSMSITGKPMHTTQGVRPSLLGALEFSSIARNIDNESSPTENATRVLRGRPRSHSVIERPLPPPQRASSRSRRSSSRPRRDRTGSSAAGTPLILPATTPEVLSASYRQQNNIELLPTPAEEEVNVFAAAWHAQPELPRQAEAQSPPNHETSERIGRLPQLVISEGMEDIEEEPLLKSGEHSPLRGVVLQRDSTPHHHEDDYIPSWWPTKVLPSPREVRHLLCPSLFKFAEQSLLSQVLSIVALPSIFLLTLTLPVVTPSVQAPPDPEVDDVGDDDDDDYRGERGWNRWLTCVQAICAPFFLASAVVEPGFVMIPLVTAAGIALVGLIIIVGTTQQHVKPRWHSYISFVGFVVSVTWISMIANEVVGVLQAFGTILGLSDAILGLTIFAVGNSLADFVADVTVARMGFSLMAFSATFGGPLMNILMGLGISGVYVNLARHKSYDTQISPTLIISCASLLTTLLAMLVLVPASGYRMTRPIGFLLIAIFFTGMVTSVLVELYY